VWTGLNAALDLCHYRSGLRNPKSVGIDAYNIARHKTRRCQLSFCSYVFSDYRHYDTTLDHTYNVYLETDSLAYYFTLTWQKFNEKKF